MSNVSTQKIKEKNIQSLRRAAPGKSRGMQSEHLQQRLLLSGFSTDNQLFMRKQVYEAILLYDDVTGAPVYVCTAHATLNRL